jgi:hypothetical protein
MVSAFVSAMGMKKHVIFSCTPLSSSSFSLSLSLCVSLDHRHHQQHPI